MGTTPKGIAYPDPAGVPNRNALETLATTTDAAIAAYYNSRERGGVAQIGLTDGVGTKVQEVVFATPMAGVPTYVVATVSSPVNDGTKLRTDNWTANGFRCILTGGLVGVTIPVAWSAGIRNS